jgi:hypothetical protein
MATSYDDGTTWTPTPTPTPAWRTIAKATLTHLTDLG